MLTEQAAAVRLDPERAPGLIQRAGGVVRDSVPYRPAGHL
jgi:hypothetical protein